MKLNFLSLNFTRLVPSLLIINTSEFGSYFSIIFVNANLELSGDQVTLNG
ncbi:MAG: hypothetical protein U0354_09690 [Candidatus Sericytochromatia bacterium]